MAALLLVMVVVAHLLYHVRAELCYPSDLWVITSEYNLAFASPTEKNKLLGPFQYAKSPEKDHRTAIVRAIAAPLVLVAVDNLHLGYKRSTGVRSGTSFEGSELKIQPMRKTLRRV